MTYATQQNLIDRFGEHELIQLTDREGLGEINTTVVDRALGDADAVINGYLAARYTLPLAAPVPTVLERLACDIARYFLHDDRATEQVEKNYKDAVTLLRDVSKGTAILGVDDSADLQTSSNGAQVSTTAPVWKRGNSQGFI